MDERFGRVSLRHLRTLFKFLSRVPFCSRPIFGHLIVRNKQRAHFLVYSSFTSVETRRR